MGAPGFNIAAVERDTGLSKDVLRMWERRYGFPQPERDANGERIYPAEQVERLRQIKRLMDMGHRPGKLIATPVADLASLAPRRPAPGRTVLSEDNRGDDSQLDELLALIRLHDGNAYQQAMQQQLARSGLQRFVQDTVAPLTCRVGEAWENGNIQVFEEHLFTELTKRLLRQAIATLPVVKGSPRVLLTSVPDEPHVLGLLMVESLLSMEKAECIPLGTEMPLIDIANAARAHRTDIVALSFSGAYPQRQIPRLLQQLRSLLPSEVALWAGGGGVVRLGEMDGIKLLPTLNAALDALEDWRRVNPPLPSA